ncbi:metallophosphoesterase [Pedobacter sp. PACM 27299]|uniref:metallophosphoesterase n=1 Tax=Pedobacter sp. PACM 27299 TaxID=1727164 RepID=UPI0007067278|nr:metallophosphoesterase [Pedobacter sp. PACM 27299]ALL05151.1 metallophosphoesterase [Pedobacter sp. PACM 27299]
MKLLTIVLPLVFSFLSLTAYAAAPSGDGPYVLYKNNQIEVSSIVVENGVQKVKLETYPLNKKSGVPINVEFSEHPEWNFSLKLQSVLKNEPAEFKQPDKLLALSDIEGEFEALRKLLLANKVMDEQYNWTFGKGQLVICGDLFDRGQEVPATIWLLYKLEQDAKAKGGYLHTILGNHDIMNLSGDLRYVKSKYFDNAKLMGLDYIQLYGPDAELGRWLRSKNLIEKIGDNLCLHAGVAPIINTLKMSLKDINNRCRPYYDQYKKPGMIPDKEVMMFFDGTRSSLFWYRGYFVEPKATEEEIDQTLALYKVKTIIVGHTITDTNVGFYYKGKVLGIDVNQHAGKHEGALYENKAWYKIDTTGQKNNIGTY